MHTNLSTNTGVSGTWITLSTAHNDGRSPLKKICQEMVKLLQQVCFADMLAGELSKRCQQSFRMFPHTWVAFGNAQNGNTSAAKIMGQEIVK